MPHRFQGHSRFSRAILHPIILLAGDIIHDRIVVKCGVYRSEEEQAEEVKKGTFREDVFYRVNKIPIKVPPLPFSSGIFP
jgi:hypothetical protein